MINNSTANPNVDINTIYTNRTLIPESRTSGMTGINLIKTTTIMNLTLFSENIINSTNLTAVDSRKEMEHSPVEIVFISLVAIILLVLTVTGNLLVIMAYWKNRRLRSVNNLFLVSLACSDLVIGIVSMSLYPVFIITEKWYFGELACDIWLCMDYTLSMASVANLMLICLDRYFSVTRPFTYRTKRTRAKAKIAIASAWIFSMLLWSPAILIWPRVKERTIDNDDCRIQFFEDPIITSVTAIIAFYLPVIVMVILYWRIYMETRRCHQYLEYLRSYKISQAGSRSPAVKRRPSASHQMSPTRSIANKFSPPRRRINSTSASDKYRSVFGNSPWRTSSRSKSVPNSNKNSIGTTDETNSYPSFQITTPECSPETPKELHQTRNNNNGTNKISSVSSVRSCGQSNTDITIHEHDSALCDSRSDGSVEVSRSSISSLCRTQEAEMNSPGLTAKNEKCSMMGNIKQIGSNCSITVVPVTVHPTIREESIEYRTPLLSRRAKSESDGFRAGCLEVPSHNPEPSLPACKQSGGNSVKVPSSERKAARTLSAILIAFILTWLPYNVCVVYTSFCDMYECDDSSKVPHAVWEFAYYLCYINSMVNPFCFAMCNTTFRDTFIQILTRKKRSEIPRSPCCWRRRKARDRNFEAITMHPSTSSSRSAPPSPCDVKANAR